MVSPFAAYPGIVLNGRFIPKEMLATVTPIDPFEKEVITYCQALFSPELEVSIETSGSTGQKKNITFPKTALIQSAIATNTYFNLKENATALLALPLAYVAGKLMVVRAIAGRYQLITQTPKSNPIKHLAQKVDFIPLTPYQAQKALNESKKHFDQVNKILLGGSPLNPTMIKEFDSVKTIFYEGFGMAETLTHIAVRQLDSSSKTRFSPLPDVKIAVDSRGCLMIDRPGITDGNIITNDLIKLHDDGFEWKGRFDHLINSGGIKIFPEEIEAALTNHIDGKFFIAGIPHNELGESVALVVEGDTEIKPELFSFLNKYHRPKRLLRLSQFVYTDSGKIKRAETLQKAISIAG